MAKPTIVIVPGAMHCEEHYKPLAQSLRSHGYESIMVSLPSTQSVDAPPAGLADDTAAIRTAVLDQLNKQNHDVVVLAHSYGGVPANNALRELDGKSRSESGHQTFVKALAFMCAIAIPAGQTIAGFQSARVGATLQAKNAVDMSTAGVFGMPASSPGAEEALYNDLPMEEAKEWAALLRPISLRVMMEQTDYAGYTDIPTGYLFCSKDEQFPLPAQEHTIAEAKKAGAQILLEERLEASHSPFLSQVPSTTTFVLKLIDQVS